MIGVHKAGGWKRIIKSDCFQKKRGITPYRNTPYLSKKMSARKPRIKELFDGIRKNGRYLKNKGGRGGGAVVAEVSV